MPLSGLLHAVRYMIVSGDGLSASVAGLLTILLCLLTSVLLAFTIHPEDAGCDGNNSGTYLGEQLVVEDDFFDFCCFLQHNDIISFSMFV